MMRVARWTGGGRSQALGEVTLPVDHIAAAYGGDLFVPVKVDEESPEPLKVQINLGRALRRTNSRYRQGFVAR